MLGDIQHVLWNYDSNEGVFISKFSLRGRVALWQCGREAADKTLPYFDHGSVAGWQQKQKILENLENIIKNLNIGVSRIIIFTLIPPALN